MEDLHIRHGTQILIFHPPVEDLHIFNPNMWSANLQPIYVAHTCPQGGGGYSLSLDGDYLSPVALVLGVRQLGVEVSDPQLAQLTREVLVVPGGLFRFVLGPVVGAPGADVDADLVVG